MNIQFEKINTPPDSSFNILVNPKLSDFYLWHFHPEYELVYIEGDAGNRHVGDHKAPFTQSDLVFIGSLIPHLNFDYGMKGDYRKSVLQIRSDFMNEQIGPSPELHGMRKIFEEAAHGIAFSQYAKVRIGSRLQNLHKKYGIKRFVEVIEIFEILSQDRDRVLLHEEPYQNLINLRSQNKLKLLYKYIDDNYHRKIRIADAALICGLGREAFCRYFKKMTKLTFIEFLNHYRVNIAKKLILEGSTVTEACYSCGYDSLSYFNRVFKRVTGKNPITYKMEAG